MASRHGSPLALLFALTLLSSPADAFLHHGGIASGSGPAGLITTAQFANNTTSAIPANSITPMFGQAFKDGDIANGCSGAAPIFKIHADNTVLPFSESIQPICWKDGSLKFAAFLARDPESIGASTNYAVSSGTYTTSTGLITLTLASPPVYSAGTIILSGLSGTGAYASLAGTWSVISVAGDIATVQGPVNLGSAVITGGTLTQPTYVQIDIYSGGTTPSPSGRSTSDYTAGGLDLNNQVTGLDSQLSGTWEADLGDGITTYGTTKYMDGAVGRVDEVWSDYKQSGTAHGQLMEKWYVAALQDQSGNLAFIRYLGRSTAPLYNASCSTTTCPPNFWSFSSYKDYNGTNLIQDLWGDQGTSFNFTWTGSTPCSWSSSIYCSSAAIPPLVQTGNLIRLTTTGSLPGGLSTGTSYFIANAGPHYSTTTFQIGTNSASITDAGAIITPTGPCTGTCTATAYPYICQFCSLYDAQANGRWNFIQGNGSISSDQPIQVIPNNAYLRSSHLIPPYAFGSYSVTELNAYPYSPMTGGPLTRFMEETGERGDIGPFPQWSAIYFFNQSENDEETIRTIGLAAGQLPINLRDATTHLIPTVNGSSYSGALPTLATTMVWDAVPGDPSGFTLPINDQVWMMGWQELPPTHAPDWDLPAFLITGEPQYIDQIEELGNTAIYTRYAASGTASVGTVTSIGGSTAGQRNNTVAGTVYHGVILGGTNLLRHDAWSWRNVSEAVFVSLGDPGCSACHQYFDDITTGTENAALAYVNLFGTGYPWVTNNGVWNETSTSDGGISDAWASGYFLNTWSMSVNLTEDGENVTTFITYLSKYFAHINNTFGTSYVPYYEAIIRQAPNTSTSPFTTTDTGVAFDGLGLSWTANSQTFTITGTKTGYTVTNGDWAMFNDQDNDTPGGLSGETTYYWCNVSGSTGQLSSTSNCSNIQTPTSSGSNSSAYFYGPSLVPPNPIEPINGGSLGTGGDSYTANIVGALQFATAVGATTDATTIADLVDLIQDQTVYPTMYTVDPKYAFQPAF